MTEPATNLRPPAPSLSQLVWHTADPDDGIQRSAIFSDCGKYRYVLGRCWALPDIAAGPRTLVNISANPSKASHLRDDATMTRMINFARREGCGQLIQLNIGAFIATDPSEWQSAADPVGPDNVNWMLEAVKDATVPAPGIVTGPIPPLVVASWGLLGAFRQLGAKTKWLLRDVPLWCFGLTKSGDHPRHPLYLPSDAPLVPYNECAKRQAFNTGKK